MAETATLLAKTETAQPRRSAPLDMFESMHDAMARLWDQRWPFDLSPITRHLAQITPGAAMWTPRVDVFDKAGELVVKAELPGANKQDIEVTLDNGDLVIRGEKKAESEVKKEHYYRMERSYGSFYRRLSLPFETTTANIHATFGDGILEIRIPKPASEDHPKAQPIEIS